jgi:hypothetical protein
MWITYESRAVLLLHAGSYLAYRNNSAFYGSHKFPMVLGKAEDVAKPESVNILTKAPHLYNDACSVNPIKHESLKQL